jgi:hypothetical protein
VLDETDGAGAPQALSWSWELDFAALMDSLNEPGPHDPTGPGAAPSGAGRSPAPASPAPAGPASTGPASAAVASAGPAVAGVASAGSGSGGASGPGAQPGVGRNAGEGAGDAVPDDLADEGVPGELIPVGVLAGRVAEKLAPGPDLAAWLSLVPAAELGDADLAATAGAWRRMAAWAQAKELAAVAQIASRSAARDEDIGTGTDSRPARIPASAAAEVALELTMSRYGASWWAGLAVDLGWRLPGTGAALESGVIDLYRARLICEATTRLSDEAARSVESKVLPAAGGQTPGMLRAALRRAVIAADPEGADRRREESERQAKVVLYPDEEHTATLAGQRLPVIHATAAMARIRAMARAWKASGACGGMDLLSAKVYLGLLLGTLPLIPPAEGAPPDIPPGDGPGDPGQDPGDPGQDRPGGSRGGVPGDGPPRGRRDGGPGSGRPPDGGPGGSPARDGPHRAGSQACDGPRGEGDPPDSGPDGNAPDDDPPDGNAPDDDPPDGNAPDDDPPDGNAPDDDPPGGNVPDDGVPPPGDQDAPRDEEDYPRPGDGLAWNHGLAGSQRDGPGQDDDDNCWRARGPAPPWPGLPAMIPPALARSAEGGAGPVPRLLDVSLPWLVLAGASPGPGYLGRIGPVPASQARRLAAYAAGDPAAEWRIIVTTSAGHAIAVTRIPRPRPRDRLPRPGSRITGTTRTRGASKTSRAAGACGASGVAAWGVPVPGGAGAGAGSTPGAGIGPGASGRRGLGLVGRVTLTIPEDILTRPPSRTGNQTRPGAGSGTGPPAEILRLALQAAGRAAARARDTAAADAAASGCAHSSAIPGYRPPPRLRDHVVARDLTCRSPVCRQPAWRRARSHHPLGRRPDLRMQPGWRLQGGPSAQAPPGLEARANRPRLLPLDYPIRPHLHGHPRHPPPVGPAGSGVPDAARRQPRPFDSQRRTAVTSPSAVSVLSGRSGLGHAQGPVAPPSRRPAWWWRSAGACALSSKE